ncbi:copper chaperone [Coemansia sp. BCRC 34301]|nr:copper chaperone [Coemansia sp. BCRC 34301]
MPIKVQLAVDMTCQSCVDDIHSVLSAVPGVAHIDISLDEKRVVVEGTAGPSAVLKALKDTGRAAVVRGTGSSNDGNIGAAVCILEEDRAHSNATRGLARFVQVSESTCFVDIGVSGIPDGSHAVAIHECGDLSQVPKSCGKHWKEEDEEEGGAGHRGDLGSLVVKDGWGELSFETDRFKVWEIIGRSVVVIAAGTDDAECILAGVVARSAGLFENDKQVCACSGNTLWTEQRLVEQGQRL